MRAAWVFLPLLFQLSCLALKPPPPLNIDRINSNDFSTLEKQTKPVGLQDALNSFYNSTNGAMTLFPDACFQSDGTPNCTAACLDDTQMFSNLETLHNCVVFPDVSIHLANNNLSANARLLAENLNIKPSNKDSSLPSIISNAIQRCLLDSCNANTDCTGTLNPINGTYKNHGSDSLTGTSFINNNYLPLCAPIPAYVDPDVGGIGVCQSQYFSLQLLLISLGIYFLHHADGASIAGIHSHHPMVVNPPRISQQLYLLSPRSIAKAWIQQRRQTISGVIRPRK